jgi:hypothetical protein
VTVHAGYGQRAKQQLLLDPLLDNHPARPNKLADTLSVGVTAVLIDLFLLDDGPGLRGKVAHGELDLSSAYADVTTSAGAAAGAAAAAGGAAAAAGGAAGTASTITSTSDRVTSTADSLYAAPVMAAVSKQCDNTAAQASASSSNARGSSSCSAGAGSDSRDCLQLLAVVFIALLWQYTPRSASLSTTAAVKIDEAAAAAVAVAIAACEQCVQFCDSYRTHFHPHTMIEVSTVQCATRTIHSTTACLDIMLQVLVSVLI